MSGSSLCCIDHEQKFEEIIRRRECGLDYEYSRSSDTFIVAWLEFAVAECEDIRLSELQPEFDGYLFCKVL